MSKAQSRTTRTHSNTNDISSTINQTTQANTSTGKDSDNSACVVMCCFRGCFVCPPESSIFSQTSIRRHAANDTEGREKITACNLNEMKPSGLHILSKHPHKHTTMKQYNKTKQIINNTSPSALEHKNAATQRNDNITKKHTSTTTHHHTNPTNSTSSHHHSRRTSLSLPPSNLPAVRGPVPPPPTPRATPHPSSLPSAHRRTTPATHHRLLGTFLIQTSPSLPLPVLKSSRCLRCDEKLGFVSSTRMTSNVESQRRT